MRMPLSNDSGWAIRRNGTCLTGSQGTEKDCGATVAPFHACCPSSTDCPSQYNVACCQAGTNCTSALVQTPRCANASWVMYDNGGEFCCAAGQVGYNLDGTNGCSKSGQSIPDGAVPLAEVSQAARPSTTTSTTSSTSTHTSTTSIHSATPSSPPETSQTNLAGPIAGGVIGGICFIAIIALAVVFIRRKRSRDQAAATISELPNVSEKDGTTTAPDRVEIDGNSRAELSSEAPARQPVYELQS
ncbi:hypothetical protein F5Y06DRAFT_121536 [Hypoxylon sp. FL0890]|nr:hypothetical protein F5Y06DRAFT_121536 [Hypoxylon sp. FL0890]